MRTPWTLPEELSALALVGADLLAADDGSGPRWFVRGAIEQADVVMITGREKLSLKTWLALCLVTASIISEPWLGMSTCLSPTGNVLVLSPETRRRQYARRLRMVCAHYEVPAERVAERIVFIDQPLTIVPLGEARRAYEKSKRRTKTLANGTFDETRKDKIERTAEEVAIAEATSIGTNIDALIAIKEAPAGTWSLIVVDTLRQAFEGDENNSADAARFTQGCREIAEAAQCPVVVIHHSNKHGEASDSRSSRGSVELTAGPDVLITLDTSGKNPTAHWTLRNNEAPKPIGYRLVTKHDAARIETCAPSVGAAKGGVSEDDVIAVLEKHSNTGLTATRVRELVSAARGGKRGSKADAGTIRKILEALVAAERVNACTIVSRGRDGREKTSFEGFTVSGRSEVEAEHIGTTVDDDRSCEEILNGAGGHAHV